MMTKAISLVMGMMFGLGLCVSGMVNPAKVIGFLDVTGNWDPSLAMVMAGGLAVSFVSFAWQKKFTKPVCCDEFVLPSATQIDWKLIAGSAVFGIGWGLGGICPGPAIAALGFGTPKIAVFFVSMVIGMTVYEWTLGSNLRK